MATLIRQYPGIIFREGKDKVDKNGRFVCQINFCPFPNKRVYKTIRLERKSYREASEIRNSWINEYLQKHPHQSLENKKDLSFSELRNVLLRMMEYNHNEQSR